MSLPSRPRENSLAVPLPSSTEFRQGIDPKVHLKGKEILPKNIDLSAGKNEEDTTESSNTNDSHNLPLNPPPKHHTPVLILQDKAKEAASESSIVPEDKKEMSTNILSNKLAMSSKSSAFSAAEWTELLFVPGQIKPLSVEARYSPLPGQPKGRDDARLNLVQKTLCSTGLKGREWACLIFGETETSKSSDKEKSTDQLSSSPNTFVSEKFELSFEITLRLNLDITIPRHLIIHRHGPYPTLRIWAVEHKEYPRTTGLQIRLRRMSLAREPTIVQPVPTPPSPRRAVIIPWKGKHIIFRLPPVPPASASVQENRDSTKS